MRGLIIDPYNELDHSRPPGKTEHEYVSEWMARLRRFAKANLCHVFLVAHPKQRASWRGEAPTLNDISGGANFFAKCDNGIVVHRDWSQLKDLRGGGGAAGGAGGRQGQGRPRSKSAAVDSGGGEEQQAGGGGGGGKGGEEGDGGAGAFLGCPVQILVQKVRSKTTGSRGVALLDYDPTCGRYHELGEAPRRDATGAVIGADSGGGAAGAAGGGDGGAPSLAREGAADGLVVTDAAEAGDGAPAQQQQQQQRVDDALAEARYQQEQLLGVKARAGGAGGDGAGADGGIGAVFDFTAAREQTVDDSEDEWTREA